MPIFVAYLSDDVNGAMTDLYNRYKEGKSIDDCWKVVDEDVDITGTYYEKHPEELDQCPIFESAEHNVDSIDMISSFTVLESSTRAVYFYRCKSNEYWTDGAIIRKGLGI